MKRTLLILLIGFFSFQSFGQDPDPVYFQTWYLIYAEADLGDDYLVVEDIEPPISPYLTIYETLDFEGFGACNSFLGHFTFEDNPNYGDIFTPFDYSQTNETCEFEEHTNFDNEYFIYFQNENISLTAIHYEDANTGIGYLELEYGPGFLYHYQNTPLLSSNDIDKATTTIYPNPVSKTLYISSEKTMIESIVVYSISGKIVLKRNNNQNNAIDVSSLSKGMYFIELYSTEEKTVKKFMKK